MRLYSTQCSTDWKCRPVHTLRLLGEGTVEELLVLRDQDIRETKAEALVDEVDEELIPDLPGWDDKEARMAAINDFRLERTKELLLLSDEELHDRWKDSTRFEMKYVEEHNRELVLCNDDGFRETLVYHFVDSPDQLKTQPAAALLHDEYWGTVALKILQVADDATALQVWQEVTGITDRDPQDLDDHYAESWESYGSHHAGMISRIWVGSTERAEEMYKELLANGVKISKDKA